MLKISRTKRFDNEYKKFVKHNLYRAESIIQSLSLVIKDPQHPSLHIEKLQGAHIWSMRIDRGNRIFFLWVDKGTILLVDIGSHDKYRKY